MSQRTATRARQTKETKIEVAVNLDGTGDYEVSTGIGFLDHMLEQLSRHSLIDLKVAAEGDLHIDFTTRRKTPALSLAKRCARL